MRTRLRIAARTHAGLERAQNEDSYLVADLATASPLAVAPAPFGAGVESEAAFALAVADGIGGRDCGDVASRLAVTTLAASLGETPLPGGPEARRDRLTAALNAASGAIYDAACSQRSLYGGGAWAVLAVIEGDRLDLAAAGDGALAFVLRRGRLARVTVTFARCTGPRPWTDADELAEFAARVRASMPLGMAREVSPTTSTLALRAGDVLLLCSDGLTDIVPRDSIEEVLQRIHDPAEACLALVSLAVRWGPDDVTVLVARPEGAALRAPAPEDEITEAEHHVL